MPRRVSLPGASELFRPTRSEGPTDARESEPPSTAAPETGTPAPAPVAPGAVSPGVAAAGTGRVRHEEKITVYVSRDELLALEQARLTLRRTGLAVDRGRIVREALALALGDLEHRGADSDLAQRLSPAASEPQPDPQRQPDLPA